MIDIHIDSIAHDLWVLSALKDGEDFELGSATAEPSKCEAIELAKRYKKEITADKVCIIVEGNEIGRSCLND